jgi:TfoX/Sxy family transcriptional regulator of competence genes
MAYSENYLNFVIDQLSEFGDFEHKKMFGGIGFFKDGKMFAGIMKGNFCRST